MQPIELMVIFIIVSYLRDILDGIILGLYKVITGKEIKEVTIKWSRKK
jgi:hypothetical protein